VCSWLDASSAAEAAGAEPSGAPFVGINGSGAGAVTAAPTRGAYAAHVGSPEPHFEAFRAALGLGPSDVFEQGIGAVVSRFLQYVPAGGDALSRDDFAAAVVATFFTGTGKPAPPRAVMQALFDAFDADGDGSVDVSELMAGLSLLLGRDQDDKVAAAFLLYDEDGECGVGSIDSAAPLRRGSAPAAHAAHTTRAPNRSCSQATVTSLGTRCTVTLLASSPSYSRTTPSVTPSHRRWRRAHCPMTSRRRSWRA